MKYQLVVQWPSNSITDYDALIEIEDLLIEQINGEHEVDGHDAGSSEMNIFVLTKDFGGAFREVRRILQAQGFWKNARVAYREIHKSQYTILWPNELKEFSVA